MYGNYITIGQRRVEGRIAEENRDRVKVGARGTPRRGVQAHVHA